MYNYVIMPIQNIPLSIPTSWFILNRKLSLKQPALLRLWTVLEQHTQGCTAHVMKKKTVCAINYFA